MCHRLCSLSTYRLKAHIREISTLSKLNFGTALLYLLPEYKCILQKLPKDVRVTPLLVLINRVQRSGSNKMHTPLHSSSKNRG